MDLSNLSPKTTRTTSKRIGRGGKRGTTSGAGTKGQKSRAGASVRPGFRGGDNRIWQLFPKLRGAKSKPGNKRPHRKHRYSRFPGNKRAPVNLGDLGAFREGDTVSPQSLAEKGLVPNGMDVKILGQGTLGKKLTFKDVALSESAKSAIEKAGGTIQ
ncbi:MAG TPA: 50S ribosomal protein L15 [Candidatus Paceibacterota bacterium]|nr:50S ribosomal protein L15 [Candidatus Paceibacterota bacterium]